jgi:hypothetical protein
MESVPLVLVSISCVKLEGGNLLRMYSNTIGCKASGSSIGNLNKTISY